MAVVTDPFTFVNGTVADADEVNLRFDRLYNLQNGNIDINNMNASAIFTWTGDHSWTTTSTTTTIMTVSGNSLTTGKLALFSSGSTDASARDLVCITNASAAAVGATCLKILQNSDALGIDIVGDALVSDGLVSVSSDSADATARNLVSIVNDNVAATGTTGLAIKADAGIALDIDTNINDRSLVIETTATSAAAVHVIGPARSFGNALQVMRNDSVGDQVALSFDGLATASNYEWEFGFIAASGDFVIRDQANTVSTWQWFQNSGAELIVGDLTIPATSKLRLDGNVAGNTSIRESAGDTIMLEMGGTDSISFGTGSRRIETGSNNYEFFFDFDNDTSLRSPIDDTLTLKLAGSDEVSWASDGTQTLSTGSYRTDSASTALSSSSRAEYAKANCITSRVRITASSDITGVLSADYNVSSVTRITTGVKRYQVVIDTDVGNALYTVLASCEDGTSNRMFSNVVSQATTDYEIRTKEESGATEWTPVMYGCSIGGV